MVQFSCRDDNDAKPNGVTEFDTVVFPKLDADTIVVLNVNGDQVPVYVSLPENCYQGGCPAVVILHGSGGQWKNDDRDAGELNRQYAEWQELLNKKGMAAVFIDSYTPRGCIEREGEWKEAPKAFTISSQFVRPYDAYSALGWLRSLRTAAGSALIQSENIALMGFSDGATALSATLYDTDQTPENWEWTQKYDREYTESDGIGIPAARPEQGGFTCGVFYYGGSVGNSYWKGNPCTNEDYMYVNYAPILYQIPELGYLTENTLCAVEVLKSIDAPVTSYVYEEATHGFDGNNTDEVSQRDLGRQRTLDWLASHFTE